MKKNIFFLLYLPIRVIDKVKGYKSGGSICIKVGEDRTYLAFKTEELAKYCRELNNIDCTIIKSNELGEEYPELLDNIDKICLFESLDIYEEYLKNKNVFDYNKYIKPFVH